VVLLGGAAGDAGGRRQGRAARGQAPGRQAPPGNRGCRAADAVSATLARTLPRAKNAAGPRHHVRRIAAPMVAYIQELLRGVLASLGSEEFGPGMESQVQ